MSERKVGLPQDAVVDVFLANSLTGKGSLSRSKENGRAALRVISALSPEQSFGLVNKIFFGLTSDANPWPISIKQKGVAVLELVKDASNLKTFAETKGGDGESGSQKLGRLFSTAATACTDADNIEFVVRAGVIIAHLLPHEGQGGYEEMQNTLTRLDQIPSNGANSGRMRLDLERMKFELVPGYSIDRKKLYTVDPEVHRVNEEVAWQLRVSELAREGLRPQRIAYRLGMTVPEVKRDWPSQVPLYLKEKEN